MKKLEIVKTKERFRLTRGGYEVYATTDEENIHIHPKDDDGFFFKRYKETDPLEDWENVAVIE